MVSSHLFTMQFCVIEFGDDECVEHQRPLLEDMDVDDDDTM